MKKLYLKKDEILNYTGSELCEVMFGLEKEDKIWIIQELVKEEKERRFKDGQANKNR